MYRNMLKSLNLIRALIKPIFSMQSWQTLGKYVGFNSNYKNNAITDLRSLSEFLNTRASHVAQSALYGYLRTRAGTRFPELFRNEDIMESINIAKWHIWLACLSDLCVFMGQLIIQSGLCTQDQLRALMTTALHNIMEEIGIPEEAGPDFVRAREKVLQRINTCDWSIRRDDDTIFSLSPNALVYWAPIAHDLKVLDEEIVINSVRFRWIEIRRSARKLLDSKNLAQAI